MTALPTELWLQVVAYSDVKDLCNLRLVSRYFNSIIEPIVWKSCVLQLTSTNGSAIINNTKGMTLLPGEFWKIHKVFGLIKSKEMFSKVKNLYISTSLWRSNKRRLGDIDDLPPKWYAHDHEHTDWFTPLIPSFFTNIKSLTIQFSDFRSKNCNWIDDSAYILGLFPNTITTHVEIIYRSNLRLHSPIPTIINCDSLRLNLLNSPITNLQLQPLSPRTRRFEIDTIAKNKVVLANVSDTLFTAKKSLELLHLNCVIDDLDWLFELTKLQDLSLFDMPGAPQLTVDDDADANANANEPHISLPLKLNQCPIKYLTIHVAKWDFLEYIEFKNIDTLCLIDRRQLINELTLRQLYMIEKIRPRIIKLVNIPPSIHQQLKSISFNIIKTSQKSYV